MHIKPLSEFIKGTLPILDMSAKLRIRSFLNDKERLRHFKTRGISIGELYNNMAPLRNDSFGIAHRDDTLSDELADWRGKQGLLFQLHLIQLVREKPLVMSYLRAHILIFI